MARIAGVDIPDQKKIEFSLRYIFGIGPTNVYELLNQAKVTPGVRVKDLSDDEVSRIQKVVEAIPVEGELRREITQNIKRLEEAGSYRGLRHRKNLPVRGQRTRSNARTKRGKRMTVGSIKKELTLKTGAPAQAETAPEGAKKA
jgi:small subunit ribosomal protein S13